MKQYRGHHNEYALLPLHVNEEEGLLIAGGLIFFFFPLSLCIVYGSDFLMSEGCFLGTAVRRSKAIILQNSEKN